MLDMDWIAACASTGRYYLTTHAERERDNDKLDTNDIEQALTTGRILEHYPDTGRGDSCLVVGFADQGMPLHVVVGRRGEEAVVITVYIPSPPKFRTPWQRGR